MSGQYLEAHAFLKTLRDKGVPYTETLVNLMQYAVIEEVAPVVHAHWVHRTAEWNFTEECSKCHFGHDYRTPFCPICGAKMDEEVDNGG